MRITINENNAYYANQINSFRGYKENSATNTYILECEEVEAKINEVDEKYQDQIIKLVDRFTTKLGNYYNDYYRNEASCPSVMISGGANFPTKKKANQNSRRETLYNEYKEIQELKQRIINFKPRLDQDDEVTRLTKEIEYNKKYLEEMKIAAAYFRKHENIDDCPISKEVKKEGIMRINLIKGYKQPPFDGYNNSLMRDKIKRLENNLAKLTAPKQEAKEKEVKEGIIIIENAELDRLQILFDDIPSVEIRNELKSNGFRWSPTNKAWQRQLTSNAKFSLKRLSFLA